MPYDASEKANETSSDGEAIEMIKAPDGSMKAAKVIKAPKDSALTRITRPKGTTTDNPLVPWYRVTGIPPSYYDDILPAHRDLQGAYFLRIGDCNFFIPPLFIKVTNATPTQRIPTLRQRESINISSGYNNRDIELSLWFNDVEQINGIACEAPESKTFYMDGLRSLVAQFKRTPFMPVVNELLNSVYGIYACTLVNISTSTVPGFPDCLQVTLNMKEFNAHPFIGAPTPVLEKMYCWPIFRWYYQQMLLDDEQTLARTRLPKIRTSNLTGKINFKLLPESILAAPKKASAGEVTFETNGKSKLQYEDHEYIWMEDVQMHYDDFTVESIQIGLANIVTDLQLAYYQAPTHQFLGSLDTMITLNITTESRQVMAEFVSLHDTLQMYSRKYKDKIACGYIGIENELINMFAVETATIQGLDITTIEGEPDLFSIRLTLLSFNKTQKDNESAKPLAPHQVLGEAVNEIGQITKDKSSYKNPMILDGVLEDMVNELEVYPDLELPTYFELRKAVDKINEWRKSKGLKDLGAVGTDFLCPYEKIADVVVKEEEHIKKSWRDREVHKWPGPDVVENGAKGEEAFDLYCKRLIDRGWLTSEPDYWTDELAELTSTMAHQYMETDGYGGRVGNNAWDAVVNINWRATKPYPDGYIFKLGSTSEHVGECQEALSRIPIMGDANNGYYWTGGVDNYYSGDFKQCIMNFQQDSGFLNVDGAIGVNTWSEIFVAAGVTDTVIPPVIEHHETEDSYFVEPDFYVFYPNPYRFGVIDENVFNDTMGMIRDGDSNGMLDQSMKTSGNGKNAIDNMFEMHIKAQDLGADYGVPAKNAIDGIIDIPHVQDSELYKLMMHDMYAYGRRYTMTRAFPAALFIFVDEGQRVRGTRLWSNLYAYHSIISISVTGDTEMPAQTCELILSNVYHNLDTNPSYATADKKDFLDAMFLEVDKQMIESRKRLYEYMAIKPGCRIHLRMGYGSSPQSLPTAFNGVVSEIDVGDVITIIGQSDGVELTNPMQDVAPEDSNGIFNLGTEPSNIIRTIMTARDEFQASFTWKKGSEGVFNWLFPDSKNNGGVSNSEYAGFANGSKYGIEHFGYVFVNDEENANLMAFFHVGDQGRWAYDTCKNIYKGSPFFADEGKYRKTTDISNEKWFEFDEENIYMYLYGKAPWDVFKHLAAASTDFITATHAHNFRSTLFFGQPQWLMKYGYMYVGGNNLKERKDIRLYYEKVKSFQQVHIVDSIHDIIDNQIQANTQGVITAVIPTYVLGSTVKTDMTIFADRNIYPECQRTAYYDTTEVQNFWGPDLVYKAILGLNFAKKNARTMGLSYLQHSFRNMYKGEIIMLGDASLKPYDITYVTDTYSKLTGPCAVGRVTHMMSIETGFITSYKPDLISVSKEAGSVGTARTLSAVQLFCFNVFTSKMAMHSAATLDRAIEVFKMDKKQGIVDVIEQGQVAIDATAALAVLALGPVSWIGVLLAMTAWVMVDELVEWCLNVFTGRNDHGITVIPMYYKDKPFLGYLKGYKELIPFQEDESLNGESSYIADLQMDKSFIQQTITERQAEFDSMNNSLFRRRSTGIDIFHINTESSVKLADIDYRQAYMYGGAGSGGSGSSAMRDSILAEARKIIADCQNGKAGYKWGGHGEVDSSGITRYDCSGYTSHCYSVAGITMTPQTDSQLSECKNGGMVFSVSDIDKALPGDLILYGNESGTDHVAIYAGNGRILAASTDKKALETQILEEDWNAPHSPYVFARHPMLVAADQASASSSSGSEQISGNIDGWGYVHKFSGATLTNYSGDNAFYDGTPVKGMTNFAAAAHNMKAGTKIYIPALKGKVNSDGVFTVHDTGGPYMDFDIFTNYEIGKIQADVYILEWGDGKDLWSFEYAEQWEKDNGYWDRNINAWNNFKDISATMNFKQPGFKS